MITSDDLGSPRIACMHARMITSDDLGSPRIACMHARMACMNGIRECEWHPSVNDIRP
jgi:hypothetical protein